MTKKKIKPDSDYPSIIIAYKIPGNNQTVAHKTDGKYKSRILNASGSKIKKRKQS